MHKSTLPFISELDTMLSHMAFILSLPSLIVFLAQTSVLLLPSSSSTPHQSLNLQPNKTGFRVGVTHVDRGHNFTKLQLVQISIHRSKNRLGRLNAMATSPPPGNGVRAPVCAGEGEFLMNLSIGTPPLPFSAIMDTGSDLIWTQCMPCTECYKQSTPFFDPIKSSTCSNVSCDSKLCKDTHVFECQNGCKYLYTYGDESSTEGFMAMDTFGFEDTVSIPNIGFGCGVTNKGQGLGQGSGLVGLGRGPLSLVSQLGFNKFSYCLTSIDDQKKTSSVLFGSMAELNYTSSGETSTPLIKNTKQPSFYYVSLEGITVGETLLPIPKSSMELREDGSGGMILDSGTTITYLQEACFSVLKEEIVSQMKLKVSGRSNAIGLDLCFDLPTKVDASEIEVPKLKFHFEGVDLEIPAENYMVVDEETGLMCLAMAASDGISIFGNIQQQNFLVIHDLVEETVSFVPTQCGQF